VRQYRSAKKLAGSHGANRLENLQDGRIYSDWRQIGTATGGNTGRRSPRRPGALS
jgi:hypothetical protein